MNWISVKERLPEFEGDYFCYNDKDREYYIGRFSERERDGSNWHDNGFSIFPSHWTVPEPPKE